MSIPYSNAEHSTESTDAQVSCRFVASIVIPSRNRRKKILTCLEGLRNQTRSDFEVVLVDDCSSDDTVQGVQDYLAEHKEFGLRVTFLKNNLQRGANPSRNLAISSSRSEIIAFLDDDCIPHEDWLENIIQTFDSEDDVAAVQGWIEDYPPRSIYEQFLKGQHYIYTVDEKNTPKRFAAGNLAVRKRFLYVEAFDESLSTPTADSSVSGRGDEIGLFHQLKNAGEKMRMADSAIVIHDHPFQLRNFTRQAFRVGGASARVGYKFGEFPRTELLVLLAADICFLLSILSFFALIPAILLALLFLLGTSWHEFTKKKKTLWEFLVGFPAMLLYFQTRAFGYAWVWMRIGLGIERVGR